MITDQCIVAAEARIYRPKPMFVFPCWNLSLHLWVILRTDGHTDTHMW